MSQAEAVQFGPVSLSLYAALSHSLEQKHFDPYIAAGTRRVYVSDDFGKDENLPHQNQALLHAISRRFNRDQFLPLVLSKADLVSDKFGGTISNLVRIVSETITTSHLHFQTALLFVDLTEIDFESDKTTHSFLYGEFEHGLIVMLSQYPTLNLFAIATKQQLETTALDSFVCYVNARRVDINT